MDWQGEGFDWATSLWTILIVAACVALIVLVIFFMRGSRTRRRKRTPDAQAIAAGLDGVFDTFDAVGNRIRYTPDDFEEILSTEEAPEMRRLVGLGWLLLDQYVGRDPGRRASWLDTGYRRMVGRVLPAQTDPEYVPPSDVTTYVLGHLRGGATGTHV